MWKALGRAAERAQELGATAQQHAAVAAERAQELGASAQERASTLSVQAQQHAAVAAKSAQELGVQAQQHAALAAERASTLREHAAVAAERVQTAAERVDLDSKKAFLRENAAKASAFIENSIADDLDICYITPRIIAMGMPGAPPNTLARVARRLSENHGTRYMVWNLSEVSYDYGAFNDQVLEFRFPGHPSPPLELLVRICDAVQNWLAADAESVAVLHCRTGRRRTCTVIACLMAWLGEAASPVEALQIVAQRRGVPISALTIPSQRRACSSGRAPLALSA